MPSFDTLEECHGPFLVYVPEELLEELEEELLEEFADVLLEELEVPE